MRTSQAQVLEACAPFDAHKLSGSEVLGYQSVAHYGQFDAIVQFMCDFKLGRYDAFAIVSVSFIANQAIECTIGLGKPGSPERDCHEAGAINEFVSCLEDTLHDGRVQEGKPGEALYTWKKDARTLVTFVAYTPASGPAPTGVRLSIQILDTELHPRGTYLDLSHNTAESIADARGTAEFPLRWLMGHHSDFSIRREYTA